MAETREIKIQSRDNPLLFVATTTGDDVVLDTDSDLENQWWIQDARWAGEATDEDGRPGYLLINKATGKALKNQERKEPCLLVDVDLEVRDDSLLWTFGRDEGDGFHAIFPTFRQELHLDGQKGDDDIAQDGTTVVTFDTRDASNQHWKLLLPEELELFRDQYQDYQEAKDELKGNSKAAKYSGIGAGLAGAFALYEWHKMKTDPENARRHQIGAAVAGSVATAAGGYAAYNAYQKEGNEDQVEAFEKANTREEDEKGWF